MRHARAELDSAIGHDSFLDVVANIVGILIILVLVAGIRARRAPVVAAPANEANASLAAALETDDAARRQLYGEVVRTGEEMQTVQREGMVRRVERDRLATVVALMEQTLAAHRNELDASSQESYDLTRTLTESQRQLAQLEQRLQQAVAATPEAAVIQSYPTPLSKPAEDQEVHMQLRGGRIVVIPLDQLVERFKLDARRNLYKLVDMPELTETIGPIDGFRMRYTLERHDPHGNSQRAPSASTYARLKEWTLLPQSNEMGETVDEALLAGSAFRAAVAKLHPSRTTITVWTYPDSFDGFRRIKKELYQLGFTTAGRPLPQDRLISGAPEGTKSAAE